MSTADVRSARVFVRMMTGWSERRALLSYRFAAMPVPLECETVSEPRSRRSRILDGR